MLLRAAYLCQKVHNYNYVKNKNKVQVRMCGLVITSLFLCSNGGRRRHRAVSDAGEFAVEFIPQENPR